MAGHEKIEAVQADDLARQVKGAVLWRSGGQILAQLVTWAATFLVLRLLDPSDYGLFAMTQVVLVFLNLMNGWGFASGLVRSESVDRQRIAQVFGMLLLLNGALAAVQFAAAPAVAAYFRQPILADMLRVQAVLYITTPFAALPTALLSRKMDFTRPAKINLVSAVLSAATALGLAAAGWGVWALVAAPITLFFTRAIGLTLATRWLVWPSFRFAGAGPLFSFGGAMVVVQFFWFVQSQSDVFIAGRMLGPHDLGLYTAALFLTQILAAKFVPPLNDVAFAAYSRIQTDSDRVATGFLKATRLIMLAAFPFYFGLAATAEPLVLTFLGAKWAETVAIVPVLALAMPFLTLQILFAPATNALGRPAVAIRTGMAGALILPAAFFIGIRFGISGLAHGWLGGMALLCLATATFSLPVLGLGLGALWQAIRPGLLAAGGMALAVLGLDSMLPAMEPQPRLMILVASGMAAYAGLLAAFARPLVAEVLDLIRGARPTPAAA